MGEEMPARGVSVDMTESDPRLGSAREPPPPVKKRIFWARFSRAQDISEATGEQMHQTWSKGLTARGTLVTTDIHEWEPEFQSMLSRSIFGFIAFKLPTIEKRWQEYVHGELAVKLWRCTRNVVVVFFIMLCCWLAMVFHYAKKYSDEHLIKAYGATLDFNDLRSEAKHWRDLGVQFSILVAVHLLIGVVLLVRFRPISDRNANDSIKRSIRHIPIGLEPSITAWFCFFIGTCCYIDVYAKFSRAHAYTADKADGSVDGRLYAYSLELLLEYARSTNYCTAVINLGALSFFLHGARVSYTQAAVASSVTLVATVTSWCVQPSRIPLGDHSSFMWAMLLVAVIVCVGELFLVRGNEFMRRRLFHLMQVLETQNANLKIENQELRGDIEDEKSKHNDLDLESPLQKVIALLRRMQDEDGLGEWHEQIDMAVHFLSRRQLKDLFLPSGLHDGVGGAADELVQITQMVGKNADALGDADLLEGRSGDRTSIESNIDAEVRHRQILRQATESISGDRTPKQQFALGANAVNFIHRAASIGKGLLAPADKLAGINEAARQAEESSAERQTAEATVCTAPSPRSFSSAEDVRLGVLEENIKEWDFGEHTVFGMYELFGNELLFFMMEHALREFDLFHSLKIDAEKLHSLCGAIMAGYNDHPYHNCLHACDVMHGTYWLLRQKMNNLVAADAKGSVAERISRERRSQNKRASRASRYAPSSSAHATEYVYLAMSANSLLASLVAGAIHDINHDGFNNAWHVAIGSEWALTYNDKSVLENMHTSVGLRLLVKPDHDILDHLTKAAKQEFRTLTVDMILGTDLSVHFEQLSTFNVKIEEGFKLTGEKNDLPVFLANILHAADLGSTSRPPTVYYNWMQRVFLEFFEQGSQQKARGLEVTPFMDRDSASISKAQQGFLKYICQPVYAALAKCIPECSGPHDTCGRNIDMLKELENFSTDQIMAQGLRQLIPGFEGAAGSGAKRVSLDA